MSEIRVNTIVAAEGLSAPNLPYGVQIPTGMGITGTGGINITGVCTATDFSGVSAGAADFPNGLTGTTGTFSGAVAGSTGTFSGAVNVDATTDSTSSTTGALIVDGGLGVAKNVFIGAGLSVAGTLTYQDVTEIDAVGLITAQGGIDITGGGFEQTGGGEFKVGTGVTIASTSGVTTFAEDANFIGAAGKNMSWDKSDGALEFIDDALIKIGTGGDLRLYHDGSNSYVEGSGTGELRIRGRNVRITDHDGSESFAVFNDDGSSELYFDNTKRFETTNDGTVTSGIATATGGVALKVDNKYISVGAGGTGDLQLSHNGTDSIIQNNTGNLEIRASELRFRTVTGETIAQASINGEMQLYYDNNEKFRTTYEGTKVSGMMSATAGLAVTGGMWEGAFIKAGKLSDNLQIGISTSNVHVFTTTESTTATPNIRWDDTYALSSKMNVGDTVSVTIITTAAAGGYAANVTIDGNAVTEEWLGGSAPSGGGSGGYDVYTYTLVRKAAGTGDTGWICLANVSNYA